MDKERYIKMCEALGDEIDLEKIPPDFDDFPEYVQDAFNIFNALTDTYTGGMEPIYCGKNYSGIDAIFKIYEVPEEDQRLTFDIIYELDLRARKKAIKQAEAARRKGKAR